MSRGKVPIDPARQDHAVSTVGTARRIVVGAKRPRCVVRKRIQRKDTYSCLIRIGDAPRFKKLTEFSDRSDAAHGPQSPFFKGWDDKVPERSATVSLFFSGDEIVQAVGKDGAAHDTAQLMMFEVWPAVAASTEVRSVDIVFERVVEVVACCEPVMCKETVDGAMYVLLAGLIWLGYQSGLSLAMSHQKPKSVDQFQ